MVVTEASACLATSLFPTVLFFAGAFDDVEVGATEVVEAAACEELLGAFGDCDFVAACDFPLLFVSALKDVFPINRRLNPRATTETILFWLMFLV